MSRWYFLGPFLALRVLGGCASSDSDVQPTVSTGLELTMTDEDSPSCGGGVWQRTGRPAIIAVRSALVTESCRCQYTTTASWSCSSAKECESEYDLGGENPRKCDAVGRQAVTIEGASASTNRSDCVVAVTFDASSARLAVECSAAGYVSVFVTVRTSAGTQEDNHELQFTDPETACPEAAADAGPSEDASDAATLGDGQALDAEDPDAQDR